MCIVFEEYDHGYIVIGKNLSRHTNVSESTTEENINITGLRKYWNYSAIVQVENTVGLGPFSDVVWAFTGEDSKLHYIECFVT